MIYQIREYRSDDIGSLCSLWSNVFGDPVRLVERFFELLPSMGTGFAAEFGDEVFGAAYVLDAFLLLPDGTSKKVAYIYAVGVDELYRDQGIGKELTKACMRKAWEDSINICCTLPAEGSLYGWYEKKCGFKPATFCGYETVSAGQAVDGIHRMHADEYGFMRDNLLKGRAHISFYYGYLLFQEALLEEYGGGFFEYKGGIACGYVENDTLYVKEVINDAPEFIPALCAMLGAKCAVIRRADASDEPYIAAYDGDPLPPDTVWNLTLD